MGFLTVVGSSLVHFEMFVLAHDTLGHSKLLINPKRTLGCTMSPVSINRTVNIINPSHIESKGRRAVDSRSLWFQGADSSITPPLLRHSRHKTLSTYLI